MTQQHGKPEERATKFLERLVATKDDRGKMACLRRGLSPGTRHYSWQVLAAIGGASAIDDPVCETVAACFALHPENKKIGNFGVTCQKIGKDNMDAFERHFRRLIASGDRRDVCVQVANIVKKAKSEGVAIDYETLFVDLYYWSDRVKVCWAQKFWSVPEEPDETSEEGAP
jgi:CRISPR type I-E-associated protein CasB/Cse2